MVESSPNPRIAELVLVPPDGSRLVRLQPLAVATPWWQDAEPVVEAVKTAYRIEVKILRILDSEQEQPHGGAVTYLAEGYAPVGAASWSGTLNSHPLRLPYADPGGPDADLKWALSVLDSMNISSLGPAQQIRTWNLSSIWRIPIQNQHAWLKVVPPFFAHEARLIASMQHLPVPQVLGHDGGRMLLAEIPGHDQHEPEVEDLLAMIELLVDLQAEWRSRINELITLGVPDWRAQNLGLLIEDVFVRTSDQLDTNDCTEIENFLYQLPSRFARLAECGIDDALVHGDFHPGNLRKHDDGLTLLDWGDAGIGHPMLDQPAFIERVPERVSEAILHHWNQRCLQWWPKADPVRARILIGPIAAARQATVYRRFLDNIEPSEWRYHNADPAIWLRRAAQLARAERYQP